jgi:AcrR family transcriptional regulator
MRLEIILTNVSVNNYCLNLLQKQFVRETMTRTNKRAQQREHRRQEILELAYEEFVAHGYEATRLENVAQKAGITRGTIYFHFESKEKLFEAMVRHTVPPDITVSAEAIFSEEVDCFERIRKLMRLVYDSLVTDERHRNLLRLISTDGAAFPEMVELYRSAYLNPIMALLKSVLDQGIEKGEFKPVARLYLPELLTAPAFLLALHHGILKSLGTINPHEFFSAHINFALYGLAGQGPGTEGA